MITLTGEPTEVKLVIAKGKTFGFSGTFDDDIDITGYEFRLMVRRTIRGAVAAILDCSVHSGHVVLFPDDKRFTLTVSAAETAELPTLTGARHEFEFEQLDGVVRGIWHGECDITGEVSRLTV